MLEERGDEDAHALAGNVKAIDSKPIQNGNGNGVAHKNDESKLEYTVLFVFFKNKYQINNVLSIHFAILKYKT